MRLFYWQTRESVQRDHLRVLALRDGPNVFEAAAATNAARRD